MAKVVANTHDYEESDDKRCDCDINGCLTAELAQANEATITATEVRYDGHQKGNGILQLDGKLYHASTSRQYSWLCQDCKLKRRNDARKLIDW